MNDISDKSCIGIFTSAKPKQIYRGQVNTHRQKHGDGYLICETNQSVQKYYGKFKRDNLHGTGTYTQIKHGANYMYEGGLYVNRYEGYAKVIYGNCTYFEGLFQNDKRFGPGVLSNAEGFQDVGWWNGTDLMRLVDEVWPERVPQLAQTNNGKLAIFKYRKLVSLIDSGTSGDPETNVFCNESIRNPTSYFFDKTFYDSTFYNELDNYIEVAIDNGEESEISQPAEEALLETSETQVNTIRVTINNMIKNMIYHHEYSPKELYLLQLKCKILAALVCDNNPNSHRETFSTKKVLVTDLLAWNNEQFCIDVLKHSFKNRRHQHMVNFDVTKLLKGDRSCFGPIGIQESACIAFLAACSEGRVNDVSKLFTEFQMNPDVTDSNGNGGVIYAASRDHIKIIKVLTNLGVKLDLQNDEGLTSLNICLLRYISVFKGITNWEAAFLNNNPETNSNLAQMQFWNAKELLMKEMTHSYFSNVSYCEGNYFQQHKDLILDHLTEISAETKSLNWFLEKMGISEQEIQLFQSFYEYNNDPKQNYLFNWDMVQGKKKKKKKPKVPKKLNLNKLAEKQALELEIENKLQVISNTLQVLLHLGTNPNIGEVPMPAVILALYSDNVNILLMVLHNGNVDIANVYGENQLGLLHVLASMPATENMTNLAEGLLNEGFNARLRTNPNHWYQERKKITGDTADPPEDCGKTPLLILATRLDFDLDEEGYLNQVAKIIIDKNRKSLKDTYLGHTPLSLAVLRGNIKLVQTLLEVGADPNECLQYGLGNALTVYCLRRYQKPKMIPPVAECEYILDILVQNWANPLLPIGEFGNALEFIEGDHYQRRVTDANKAKNKKKKKGKKEKEKGSKKGKSKKGKKKTGQDEVKEHLLQLTKLVLLRNIQGKVFNLFFNTLIDGTIQNYKNLALFLTVDDTLRIIRLLHQQKTLNLSNDVHYFICVMLLEFIKLYGFKITAKKKRKKKKNEAKPKSHKKGSKKSKASDKTNKTKEMPVTTQDLILNILDSKETIPKYKLAKTSIAFELDNDRKKYVACLNCGLRTGKLLLACPICGLVYYCSQKCNVEDKNAKSRHPCKTIFFNDELKMAPENDDYVNPLETKFKNIHTKTSIPTPSQALNRNRNFNALITAISNPNMIQISIDMFEAMGLNPDNIRLDTIINRKQQPEDHDDLKTSNSKTISKKAEAVAANNNTISQITDTGEIPEAEKERIEITVFSFDNFSKTHQHLPTRQSSYQSNEEYIRTNSMRRKTTIKEPWKKKDSRTKRNTETNSYTETTHVHAVRAKSTDLKRKKTEEITNNFDAVISRVRDSVFIFKQKHSVHTLHESPTDGQCLPPKKDVKKVPNINKEFINTLNKLFPNFDFTKAFAPFVCYSDSQFYYRFSEQKPEYFNTHM